ncbi:MAG: SEC-C domain-containing protein [Candidatus Peribacteraceae bacterium]|nr:SEC-C domain-containing protein [Candidatus Peribacteraceae bacterium]
MEIQLAQTYCPHLLSQTGISPKRLDNAIQTIIEFFSEDWLEDLKKLYETEKEYKVLKHPIYNGLLKGEVSVETPKVIELASCLEGLRGKSNLGQIVEEMKNPDGFNDYFYQLAIAYRLNSIDPNVELEPLVCGKTPDSTIEIDGKKCAIECTAMSGSSTYVRFHDAIEQLGSFTFAQVEKHSFPCNIHFQAKHESVTADSNMEAMKSIIEQLISGKQCPAEQEIDCCKISVLPPDEKPDAPIGMMQTLAPAEAVVELSTTGQTRHKQEYMAGFFVSYDDIKQSLEKDLADRIYSKIEKKKAQVKPLKDDYDIFLFIDTDVSWRQLMDKKDDIGKEIVENFLTEENDLFSLVVLTNRPRGKDDLFAINRSIYGRSEVSEEWLKKFWEGFMQPSVNHNFFLRTTERNDPCPCGIDLKFKNCHGYYLS